MAQHRVRLPVAGMASEHCEERVRQALESVGAQKARVDWQRGEAWFGVPQRVERAAIRTAVCGVGYCPGEIQRPRPT